MNGNSRMRVDPIACTGHGVCATLINELVTLDEWGYPIVADQDIPPELRKAAKQAASACPRLALHIVRC